MPREGVRRIGRIGTGPLCLKSYIAPDDTVIFATANPSPVVMALTGARRQGSMEKLDDLEH